MLPKLPPELISLVIVEIFKTHPHTIGEMSLVCSEWNDMMNQPFVWLTLCMEHHQDFLNSFQDSMSLLETMAQWSEKKKEQPEIPVIVWKDKFLEWEFLDEIITVSWNIFKSESYERRLATAELISTICTSKFVSVNTLLEFIPDVRSDLKAAAAIGLKSKFNQIAQQRPQYLNNIQSEGDHFPLDITPTAALRLQLAHKTTGIHDSLSSIILGLDMAVEVNYNCSNIEFPPLFQVLIDYLHILLDDRASRVSYRAVEAVGQLKPLCILFSQKLHEMNSHYNPAVAEIATLVSKSLK